MYYNHKHNSTHTTGCFINNGDKYNMYFNENYCGHISKKSDISNSFLHDTNIINDNR